MLNGLSSLFLHFFVNFSKNLLTFCIVLGADSDITQRSRQVSQPNSNARSAFVSTNKTFFINYSIFYHDSHFYYLSPLNLFLEYIIAPIKPFVNTFFRFSREFFLNSLVTEETILIVGAEEPMATATSIAVSSLNQFLSVGRPNNPTGETATHKGKGVSHHYHQFLS